MALASLVREQGDLLLDFVGINLSLGSCPTQALVLGLPVVELCYLRRISA